MNRSCRTMMVGLVGLSLGGCSVVVFEDSAACSAQKTCPIDAIKMAPVPEGIESNGLDIQTILLEEFDANITEKIINIQDILNDLMLGDHLRVFLKK